MERSIERLVGPPGTSRRCTSVPLVTEKIVEAKDNAHVSSTPAVTHAVPAPVSGYEGTALGFVVETLAPVTEYMAQAPPPVIADVSPAFAPVILCVHPAPTKQQLQ